MVLDLYLVWENMTQEEKEKQHKKKGCDGENGHLMTSFNEHGFMRWCMVYLNKSGFQHIFNFKKDISTLVQTDDEREIYQFKPDWKESLERFNAIFGKAEKLKKSGKFIFKISYPAMDTEFYPTIFESMERLRQENMRFNSFLLDDGIFETGLGSAFVGSNIEKTTEIENDEFSNTNQNDDLIEIPKQLDEPKGIQTYPEVLNSFWIRSPDFEDLENEEILEPCVLLKSFDPLINPHFDAFQVLLETRKFIDLGIQKDASIIFDF
ncbi:hypothetical protein M0811_01998 [Anaeramoeba ignava]|uniref:Uncharacterized protein n=1 Tax=Anaeramoeba ignava TaxID=1746090 RepID=A0A9Q0LD81_ANAIG|nr:hypothetical protein M0811_01998 [Anaeramoeba ignava]|eukprot:Anaeramoba_ignava/a479083_28.p1 GENE.a479083_28~~a479083_28.p1  ORF type:complete len:265 (-),score=80.10 a479083_28:40-834(-)